MRPDELDRLLTEVLEEDRVPDFDATWRRAEARVGTREEVGGGAHRVLAPAAVLGAIAGALLLGLLVVDGDDPVPSRSISAEKERHHQELLAEIEGIPEWEAPLDGLERTWRYDHALFEGEEEDGASGEEEGDAADEEPAFALRRNEAGDDLFESSTDFLLEITIPAWNGADEQRSTL
jgi:hypothetical protein